jgi:hypothetical protein
MKKKKAFLKLFHIFKLFTIMRYSFIDSMKSPSNNGKGIKSFLYFFLRDKKERIKFFACLYRRASYI